MANRTVSVGLALEVSRYRRGAAEAVAATKTIEGSLRGVAVEADRTGQAMELAGKRSAQVWRDSAGRLRDERGGYVKAGVELGEAVTAGGARGMLGLIKAAGEIGLRVGKEAGQVTVEAYKAGMSSLPDELKLILVASGLAAAGLASPMIGATIAAGISTGLGAAGVGAGVALAVRDPKVKQAGTDLGHELMRGLEASAGSFTAPVLESISIIRGEFSAARKDIAGAFSGASQYVLPLTRGLTGLVRELLPGLRAGMTNIAPVMEVVARHLPLIGSALGTFLETVTAESGNAAAALDFLLAMLEGGIITAGEFIAWLTRGLDEVVTAALGAAHALELLTPGDNFGTAISALTSFRSGLDAGGAAATGAAGGVTHLTSAIGGLNRETKSSFDAQTDFAQALRDARTGAKDLSDGIRLNSEEGLKGRKVLSDLAEKTSAVIQEQKDLGASAGKIAAMQAQAFQAFIRTAQGMGMSEKSARRLAQSLGVLPPAKTIPITLSGIAQAKKDLADFKAAINALRNKTIVINAQTHYSSPDRLFDRPRRWGGITRYARNGWLSDADVYPAGSQPLYAFAEPATRGEAFIPKVGDKARSVAIGAEAMSWYGHRVVPMARGGVNGGGLVNVAAATGRATRLDYAESYSRALDTVTALNDALKENGRSFRLSSAAGRENAQALMASVRAAQDAAQTKYDETGSVKAANAVYDQHIRRLRAVLAQQKVNASTIRSLMSAYGQRPGFNATAPANSLANISYAKAAIGAAGTISDLRDKLSLTKPDVGLGTAEGRDNLSAIISALEAAASAAQERYSQGKNATVATALYASYVKAIRAAMSTNGYPAKLIDSLINSYGRITLASNASGGLYGLSGPERFAVGASPMYGWAEPSTGGELFIPRFGNAQRGRELSAVAARWYPPNPGGGAGQGGGGHVTNNNLTVHAGAGSQWPQSEIRAAQRELDARSRPGRRP